MEMEQPAVAGMAPPMHPSQPQPQPFGLILPGKDVITNFAPADATGSKFTLEIPFPLTPSTSMESSTSSPTPAFPASQLPSAVHDLVFFLLPNIPLPSETGALLYWSASIIPSSNIGMNVSPPQSLSSGFEVLGALTPTQTSTILPTGWSSHERLQELIQECQYHPERYAGIQITLGISLEPLANVSNLQIDPVQQFHSRKEGKKNVAKKIATDLYNYLKSFDDTGSGSGNSARSGWMTVPDNVFDRWFKRFEGKIERDPNFFMKSSVE